MKVPRKAKVRLRVRIVVSFPLEVEGKEGEDGENGHDSKVPKEVLLLEHVTRVEDDRRKENIEENRRLESDHRLDDMAW